MKPLNDALRQAMRRIGTGDLRAATAGLLRDLTGDRPPPAGDVGHPRPVPARDACGRAGPPPVIEGQWRVVEPADRNAASPEDRIGPSREPRRAPPSETAERAFRTLNFSCEAGSVDYKLYVPDGLETRGAPLLLMLHGCTQSPEDFARGTRMNALALERGFVVAYPEQASDRNPNRCWSWFRPGDQKRGQGEPALLAALTQHLTRVHRLDDRRVFVAGLSAGGAMAAVLAHAYPDIFAAMGVHSGLPVGAAHDVASAFTAMRQGRSGAAQGGARAGTATARAIVFHGDRDATVHPSNGYDVIAQILDSDTAAGSARTDTPERGVSNGGRRYTRIVHRRADDTVGAEHWIIEGAGHAWSGGDPAGSFTDAAGPDASQEMLRFFSDGDRLRRR